MPRPKQCRRVKQTPDCIFFKPAGIPTSTLVEVTLGVDELEALRLADFEQLYHEAAAEQMGISRRTFGRIVKAARRKVTHALLHGAALRIEGGHIEMPDQRQFQCEACGHGWQLPFGTGRPAECPACQAADFHRVEKSP